MRRLLHNLVRRWRSCSAIGLVEDAIIIALTTFETMQHRTNRFARRLAHRSAAGLVEYTMLLTLLALVCVVMLRGIGCNVNNKLGTVSTTLQ